MAVAALVAAPAADRCIAAGAGEIAGWRCARCSSRACGRSRRTGRDRAGTARAGRRSGANESADRCARRDGATRSKNPDADGAPRRPARADQGLAIRRQHDRQGRRGHSVHRPCLPCEVRERACAGAGRVPPRRDRWRRPRAAGARLAAAHATRTVRADPAGRGDRGAVPDALRRLQVLQRARGRTGVRADGRGGRPCRRARHPAGRPLARRDRRARRLRDAAARLERQRQLHRAVQLLPRARPRHRAGGLAQDLARAEPDRLRRDLPRRDGMGRARLSARSLRNQPGVPDRVLRAVRRDHADAGAARGCAAKQRRRAACRRLGQWQPAVRPADDHVRAAVRPGARYRVRRGPVRAGAGGGLCAAGPGAAVAAPPASAVRGHARGRHGVPDARDPVRARRAQHGRRLGARRSRPGLARLAPAARHLAPLRLRIAAARASRCSPDTSAMACRRASSTRICSAA